MVFVSVWVVRYCDQLVCAGRYSVRQWRDIGGLLLVCVPVHVCDCVVSVSVWSHACLIVVVSIVSSTQVWENV